METLRASILKEADRRAGRFDAARKNAGRLRQSSRQQATLSARIEGLGQKHRCLDQVRARARGDAELDDARWAALFTKLVLETPIPGEVEVQIPQKGPGPL